MKLSFDIEIVTLDIRKCTLDNRQLPMENFTFDNEKPI